MADTCATCRFWDRYTDSDLPSRQRVGDCRCNPPLISEEIFRRHSSPPTWGADRDTESLALDLYAAGAFPVTHQASWCGRHEEPRLEIPL